MRRLPLELQDEDAAGILESGEESIGSETGTQDSDSDPYTQSEGEVTDEDSDAEWAVGIELPVRVLTQEELVKAPPGRRECIICLEEYRAGDSQATLPCFHVFHRACAREWLGRCLKCPICKHDPRRFDDLSLSAST